MAKRSRKTVIILVCIIGVLAIVLVGDLLLRFTLKSLVFQEIVFSCLMLTVAISSIPAVILQLGILRSLKYGGTNNNIDQLFLNKIRYKSRLMIWIGSGVFGISIILLAVQILKVTISNQVIKLTSIYPDQHTVFYHNYGVSAIIFFVGLHIVVDTYRSKKLRRLRNNDC